MTEGPGPESTVRVTICPVFSDAARILRGPSTAPVLATQRILLFLPATGGTAKGWFETQTMAAMFPLSPRTYGTEGFDPEKPALAQRGRTFDR
jgi:hypothetical protein